MQRMKIDISTTTIIKVALAVIGIMFLYAIREIAILFFVVLIVVMACSPLIDRMSTKIPRVLSVIIITLVFLGILTAIGFLIFPVLIEQIKLLAINLPVYLRKTGPLYDQIQYSVTHYQSTLLNASSQLGRVTSSLYTTTLGVIGNIVGVITALVLIFYMLSEKDSIEKIVGQMIPAEYRARTMRVVDKFSLKIGGWLGGHLLLMLVVGVLDGVALYIMGVPYALILGIWGGLTEIVPYIGPWLGIIPALIIGFSISPLTGLLVLIAYVVIQQLESTVLAPKILGKAVGLSPAIIILSLLIGAKLMGLMGMIIAVPLAAALSVLAQEWSEIKNIRE